jgi:hypothetical protein
MKTILKCYTLTQAESVKIALLAADIDAVVEGRSLIGVVGTPYTVAVRVEDADAAKAVLASMEFGDPPEI